MLFFDLLCEVWDEEELSFHPGIIVLVVLITGTIVVVSVHFGGAHGILGIHGIFCTHGIFGMQGIFGWKQGFGCGHGITTIHVSWQD